MKYYFQLQARMSQTCRIIEIKSDNQKLATIQAEEIAAADSIKQSQSIKVELMDEKTLDRSSTTRRRIERLSKVDRYNSGAQFKRSK